MKSFLLCELLRYTDYTYRQRKGYIPCVKMQLEDPKGAVAIAGSIQVDSRIPGNGL